MDEAKKKIAVCISVIAIICFAIIVIVVICCDNDNDNYNAEHQYFCLEEQEIINMNNDDISDLIKKERQIIIWCDDCSCDDISGLFDVPLDLDVDKDSHQQRIGILASCNAEGSYNLSEIIASPLEENSFTALDKEELQNLVMNTDMGFEDEKVNESNCSYYILYTVNNQNEVTGLAGIKLAMTMNGIKTTQTHAYREADCVFELYCNSNVRLDSYKIRVKVPKKKASIIIEEGEKADDNKADSGVFSYQEMTQDLTGLYSVGWKGSPVTNEKGAAYKAHVYATIKTEIDSADEEKASFGVTSLKLSNKPKFFVTGKKQLEKSIFVFE